MKILVYGAGVLGCNLARNLFRAGKDVTLFARGNWAAALPEKNVLFAFALSAGHRESDLVVSIDLKKITIGQLSDAASNKQLIGQIFCGTKYKVAYEPNMEDYLLCHAEFVMPAAFAYYKTDGNLKKLRRNTVYLGRVIDANIEGFVSLLILRLLGRKTGCRIPIGTMVESLRKANLALLPNGTYVNTYCDNVIADIGKALGLSLTQKFYSKGDLVIERGKTVKKF